MARFALTSLRHKPCKLPMWRLLDIEDKLINFKVWTGVHEGVERKFWTWKFPVHGMSCVDLCHYHCKPWSMDMVTGEVFKYYRRHWEIGRIKSTRTMLHPVLHLLFHTCPGGSEVEHSKAHYIFDVSRKRQRFSVSQIEASLGMISMGWMINLWESIWDAWGPFLRACVQRVFILSITKFGYRAQKLRIQFPT